MSFSKKDSTRMDAALSSSSSSSASNYYPPPSSSQTSQTSLSGLNSGKKVTGVHVGTRNKGPSKRQNYKRFNNKSNNGKPELSHYDDYVERSIVKGKKGMDISHLIDFQLPDHHQDDLLDRKPARRHRNTNGLHLTGRNYVNVNYRFIVDYRGDYRTQILDPNVPLDDSSIIRVIINKNDHHCPICLGDEFVAPRMTKCGHVFCYSCLLRLFATLPLEEAHLHKNKVKCPLCSEDIREKQELLPVLVNQVDERFERPIVGEEIELRLMYRPVSKIYAQPFQLYLEGQELKGNIPWINHESTPDSFLFNSCSHVSYSRIMKSDLRFILACFENELNLIKAQQLVDKEMYNDDGIHYEMALLKIKAQMEAMKSSFESSSVQPPSLSSRDSDSNLDHLNFNDLSIKQHEFVMPGHEKGFYFYQYHSNSSTKFVLSNLDIQILKMLYNAYPHFPLVLKLKLENINYENSVLTTDLLNKVKYLGHLPIGTELGFLELKWSSNNVPLIPQDIYSKFSKKLNERSKLIQRKKQKENRNKINFEKELELKTLQFYSEENNMNLEDFGYALKLENEFNHLGRRYSDDDAPPLAHEVTSPSSSPKVLSAVDNPNQQNSENDESKYEKTIWGTKILKSNDVFEDELDDDALDVEFLIHQAKEEQQVNGKKGKKKGKRIVLSFN